MLAGGGVLLYPTETVYGFGCDAADADACARIQALKGWPRPRPMLVLVADVEHADRLGRLSPGARALAEALWPGPLTIVLPARGGEGTVALRASPHPVARALVEGFAGALTSTSANRTGEPPPRTLAAARWEGARGPDLALDGGETEGHTGSSVVDCSGERPRLLRAGDLPVARLREVLGGRLDG